MTHSKDLIARRNAALGPTYQLFYREPLNIVRGEGVWLYDADGRSYLDCYNNVASVGHCHPRIVKAVQDQVATLATHTRYVHEAVVSCAEELTATFPSELSTVIFTCTGTEANDLAVRMARAFTGNHGVIVTDHAYHGNSTLVTELSPCKYPAGERPDYVAVIESPDPYRGRYGYAHREGVALYADQINERAVELKAAGHKPAALLCDMIFDAYGVVSAPKGYFTACVDRIHAAGGLFIADEVQSGHGRLGTGLWEFLDHGVTPDIVTLGKPMGAGYPVAAVVTRPEIAEAFAKHMSYFNTFGGNPAAAVAAREVLRIIADERLVETQPRLGPHLFELKESHAGIGDVRGKGLFWGIDLVKDRGTKKPDAALAEAVQNHLQENGILTGVTGKHDNVLKIRPPLVFSNDNADQLIAGLDTALAACAR